MGILIDWEIVFNIMSHLDYKTSKKSRILSCREPFHQRMKTTRIKSKTKSTVSCRLKLSQILIYYLFRKQLYKIPVMFISVNLHARSFCLLSSLCLIDSSMSNFIRTVNLKLYQKILTCDWRL